MKKVPVGVILWALLSIYSGLDFLILGNYPDFQYTFGMKVSGNAQQLVATVHSINFIVIGMGLLKSKKFAWQATILYSFFYILDVLVTSIAIQGEGRYVLMFRAIFILYSLMIVYYLFLVKSHFESRLV